MMGRYLKDSREWDDRFQHITNANQQVQAQIHSAWTECFVSFEVCRKLLNCLLILISDYWYWFKWFYWAWFNNPWSLSVQFICFLSKLRSLMGVQAHCVVYCTLVNKPTVIHNMATYCKALILITWTGAQEDKAQGSSKSKRSYAGSSKDKPWDLELLCVFVVFQSLDSVQCRTRLFKIAQLLTSHEIIVPPVKLQCLGLLIHSLTIVIHYNRWLFWLKNKNNFLRSEDLWSHHPQQ